MAILVYKNLSIIIIILDKENIDILNLKRFYKFLILYI